MLTGFLLSTQSTKKPFQTHNPNMASPMEIVCGLSDALCDDIDDGKLEVLMESEIEKITFKNNTVCLSHSTSVSSIEKTGMNVVSNAAQSGRTMIGELAISAPVNTVTDLVLDIAQFSTALLVDENRSSIVEDSVSLTTTAAATKQKKIMMIAYRKENKRGSNTSDRSDRSNAPSSADHGTNDKRKSSIGSTRSNLSTFREEPHMATITYDDIDNYAATGTGGGDGKEVGCVEKKGDTEDPIGGHHIFCLDVRIFNESVDEKTWGNLYVLISEHWKKWSGIVHSMGGQISFQSKEKIGGKWSAVVHLELKMEMANCYPSIGDPFLFTQAASSTMHENAVVWSNPNKEKEKPSIHTTVSEKDVDEAYRKALVAEAKSIVEQGMKSLLLGEDGTLSRRNSSTASFVRAVPTRNRSVSCLGRTPSYNGGGGFGRMPSYNGGGGGGGGGADAAAAVDGSGGGGGGGRVPKGSKERGRQKSQSSMLARSSKISSSRGGGAGDSEASAWRTNQINETRAAILAKVNRTCWGALYDRIAAWSGVDHMLHLYSSFRAATKVSPVDGTLEVKSLINGTGTGTRTTANGAPQQNNIMISRGAAGGGFVGSAAAKMAFLVNYSTAGGGGGGFAGGGGIPSSSHEIHPVSIVPVGTSGHEVLLQRVEQNHIINNSSANASGGNSPRSAVGGISRATSAEISSPRRKSATSQHYFTDNEAVRTATKKKVTLILPRRTKVLNNDFIMPMYPPGMMSLDAPDPFTSTSIHTRKRSKSNR